MIKTGKDISSTTEDINQEFSTKVDKATTIADLPLTGDISNIELIANLFVVTKERDGHPVVQSIQNGGTFRSQGIYNDDWE